MTCDFIFHEHDIFGNSVIFFNTQNTGNPDFYLEVYGKHGWTFEPADWDDSVGVFAPVYETVEDALEAAERWSTWGN